jgi:hypothetical protein
MKVFEIADGKKTEASFIRNQKTFTLDGRLIREINFDDSTRHIHDYIFYFYKGGKLFTEENYDRNDSLRFIIRHSYNSNGQDEETNKLEWIKGKMKTTGRTVYVYDNNGLTIAMKESGIRKKPFRVTNFIYASGNLVQEQSRTLKSSDNAAERILKYAYGIDGRMNLKMTLEKNISDTSVIQTENYLYNTKGQLKTIEVKDPQGKLVVSKNYEYYADGSIRNYYEKDEAGKLLLYHTYIIKRHVINLGMQKSYFDKQ